jgi:hypothetical protein
MLAEAVEFGFTETEGFGSIEESSWRRQPPS